MLTRRASAILWANWLIKHLPEGGKILEIRGVAGHPVDGIRHEGIHETFAASGKKWDVVEVVGKWDDAVAQKVTADAIVASGPFDGITGQGGDTGIVQAMIDTKHEFVPFGGETENGFRKFCAKHSGDGLKCSSAGSGPAQVAVAIKTAIAALEGNVVPQAVKLPLAIVEDPNFKDGDGFLRRPVRQFLRRQFVSDLRHRHLGDRDSRADQGKPVTTRLGRARRRGSVRDAVIDTASEGRMEETFPLFQMKGVSKRYGGVRALEAADLTVEPGQIHAILGENGAGKSTLIKIMAGRGRAGRRATDRWRANR